MIFALIIGILIIALGVYSWISTKKKEKQGRLNAVVCNCSQNYIELMGETEVAYEISLEVHTEYGVTYKTVKSEKSYNIGDNIPVYYNVQDDTIALAKQGQTDMKSHLAIIGFGVLWCAIIIMAMWAQSSPEAGEIVGKIMGIVLPVIFICIGFNLAVIKPRKYKNEMVNCTTVPGSIVNFKTKRTKKGGRVYCPQYGFYHNGQNQTFWGHVSSNSNKYREIGRQVTIVINNKTGIITCLEDENATRGFGFVFFFAGLFFLVVVCLTMFSNVLA